MANMLNMGTEPLHGRVLDLIYTDLPSTGCSMIYINPSGCNRHHQDAIPSFFTKTQPPLFREQGQIAYMLGCEGPTPLDAQKKKPGGPFVPLEKVEAFQHLGAMISTSMNLMIE